MRQPGDCLGETLQLNEPMRENEPPKIFNRRLYAQRRRRAADKFPRADFLHRRAMDDVVDRLETVVRDFPSALFYGVGDLASMLTPKCGVIEITHGDLVRERAPNARTVVFDEEMLPFAPESFDLVVSLLTLHAANDPVGALAQMRAALKPDGLLIAVLFGETTLIELKEALYAAEAEHEGGVTPRVAPFASVRDLGAVLQRAGFALPVADLDRVKVEYGNIKDLFSDLRAMGETNCLEGAGRYLRRASLGDAAARLAGKPHVTFDLLTLTGWAPHESQPKPLKPGSPAMSLKKALNPD